MAGQTIIPRDVTVSVGTSAVELSPETGTKQRQALVITNTSTGGQNIALAWGKDAIAGAGIVLLPGEHHIEAIDSAFIPLNLRVSAESDLAGGTCAVHERLTPGVG
jgi:hypothetical protein